VAVGADEEVTPAATFYEPLQVPLVSVDVVAVRKDGRPVPGLTADDFEVFEDGKRVEISHFYASPGLRMERSSEEVADQLPEPAGQQLYLVIYIDDHNLTPRRRRAALDHLRGFLERPLPAATQAMLVRFDGSLHIKSDFSADSEELLPMLEQLTWKAPVGFTGQVEMLVRDMQMVANMPAWQPTGGGETGPEARRGRAFNERLGENFVPQIHSLARAIHIRNRASLQALQDYVRFLSGVSGRKAVLWMAGGIETRVGRDLFRSWERLFPRQARANSFHAEAEASQYDTTRDLRELVQLANAHRVSFYTLSPLASGLSGQTSAEIRSLTLAEGPAFLDLTSDVEALDFIADLTGGRSLMDNPDLDEELHEVSEELANYYSLGYSPPSPGDGRYHEITVKVRQDKVIVRHRQGYREADEGEGISERTLAAAMLGVADNPLGIVLETQTQEDRGEGRFLVPVKVRIPIGELVLLPDGDLHAGQISMYLAVRDGEGRLSEVHDRQYPVEVPNARLLQAVEQQAGFVVGMVMSEGPQRIAISIRDDRSRIESTAFVDVVVGSDSQDQSG
jgi:VWFA-related protein